MVVLGMINDVSVLTKTYATIGLMLLAIFEFCTAMYVYGRRSGSKAHGKLMLTLHRIGGYAFLLYWLWPIIVGAGLLARLSRYQDGWRFDGPRFYHAFLGVVVLVMLLLKITFVRFYPNFRQWAQPIGIVVSVLAVVTWLISGWFWLCMMGGRTVL